MNEIGHTLGHTPGPWTHTLNESGSMRGVWGKPKGSNITGMVCYMTNPVSANQEGAANAHLIGASPELLAAAIDMVAQVDAYDYVHGRDSCDIDPDGLRLAIAKAKGGKIC